MFQFKLYLFLLNFKTSLNNDWIKRSLFMFFIFYLYQECMFWKGLNIIKFLLQLGTQPRVQSRIPQPVQVISLHCQYR